MNGPAPSDLFFYLTGALLALAGLTLAAWALFWDRSRGRKRCPKCCYDMSGAVATVRDGREGFVCPECGAAAQAVQLLRTRRRWWWGVAGVLAILVSGQVVQVPRRGSVAEGLGTRFVPTTLLIFLADVSGCDLKDPLVEAIARRWWMWNWQVAIVARRQAASISAQDLPSCVVTRRRWPIGSPIHLVLTPTLRMYPIVGGAKVQADLHDDPTRSMTMHLSPPYISGNTTWAPPREMDLSSMAPGEHKVSFDVTYQINGTTLARGVATCTFEVVPPEVVGVAPLRSAAIDQAIRAAMKVFLTEDQPPEQAAVFAQLDNQTVWDAVYAGQPRGKYSPSIGVTIEVLDSGRVLQTATWDYQSIIPTIEPGASAPLIREAYEPDPERPDSWRWRRDVLGRMVVRVRGDQGVACRDFQATEYWDGEVTVPMGELLPPEHAESGGNK